MTFGMVLVVCFLCQNFSNLFILFVCLIAIPWSSLRPLEAPGSHWSHLEPPGPSPESLLRQPGTESFSVLFLIKQLSSHLCLVLLQGQNNFCLGQNLNCPEQNCFVHDKIFCQWLKSQILLLKSSLKRLSCVEMDF